MKHLKSQSYKLYLIKYTKKRFLGGIIIIMLRGYLPMPSIDIPGIIT